MAGPNRDEWIVVITRSDERQLLSALRDDPSIAITAIAPDGSIGSALDSPPAARELDDSDRPTDESATAPSDTPDGVVVALDRPTAIRSVLDRVHDELSAVPTIVAPKQGSERIATAAVRADASDYVPADESTADRVLDAVDAGAGDGGPAPSDEQFHRILATELPDEAYVISETGTYLEAKIRPCSEQLYELPATDLIGARISTVFPEETATRLRDCLDRALRTERVQSVEYDARTAEGSRQYEARVVPVDEPVDGERVVVWLARDITERARRVRKLQSRRDRLETINGITAVIREVIETLVEAPSRTAIEREVCAQLADSELYSGSWIIDQHLDYRIGHGDADAVLEAAGELDADQQPLIQRAIETGDVQTSTELATAEGLPEALQTAADTDDIASLIAVPLSYEATMYGVLTVISTREDAFSEPEQAEFCLLGETIGFTIQAVKNRQLLFADTVTELEFRIHGGDTFSFDFSEAYDCHCLLEWAGTATHGDSVQFVTVEEVDATTVLEEAAAHDSVKSCRLVHDGANRCTVELQLVDEGIQTVTNHGGTIRDVTVDGGVGTCLVEVPQDADIRAIVEALTAVYEGTDLVARREIDRPVRTAAQQRSRILDELTDRQLTTLRVAYYSGFFEWPRESTGEEIAETMSISPPTMHQHLRKGLKTVLTEFFEDDGDPESG